MKLEGKVVVVTGAGSGMGRELALELARRKAKVALVDFRKETLAETVKLVKAIGGECSSHVLDVSDAKAADASSSSFPTTAADVAAKLMVDAIEANKPRLVIGKDAKTMDFLSRLNPLYAAKLIYKQMGSLLK